MSDGHIISLQEAATLTANFRNNPVAAAVALIQQKGQSFPASTINLILNQPNVASMGIFYGLELLPPVFKLIIVGVDGAGNDIVAGLIADKGLTCPPNCGVANALNSNI